MIPELFESLKKGLAQEKDVETKQTEYLQGYRLRSSSCEDIAMQIAAAEGLAVAIVTALVLTENNQVIGYLLYNKDDTSTHSRNFRYFFAREMLIALCNSWENDDLLWSREILQKKDKPEEKYALVEMLVHSLAFEASSAAEKYRYFSDGSPVS